MLKNFLLVAIRNFSREQIYAAINISGLVVGLASALFIFMWVMDEVRFDAFHAGGDHIYQLLENQVYPEGDILTYEGTPAPLAEKLRQDFPEVEQACHITWDQHLLLSNPGLSAFRDGLYTDSSFFLVFSFPVIEGNAANPLPDKNSVVITKSMASAYFHGKSALGKVLRIDNAWDATVTGVVEDVPRNSSIRFDFILPFDLYGHHTGKELDWGHHLLFTYVKLREGASLDEFSQKIKDMLAVTNVDGEKIQLFPFAMNDWRLRWNFENGVQSGGRIVYVIAFALTAVFILIAACVNFMNLATARAARRAREVGIRKVAGASRKLLIQQFMVESMLYSFVSLAIALLLSHLLTPLFNYTTGKNLSIDYGDPYFLAGIFIIPLFSGLLAGSYPAFFLSSFRPATVLKGNLLSSTKGIGLRKALVLFQFGLSVVLIICSLVVNRQVNYIKNKNIGYDKENLLDFEPRPGSLTNFDAFKTELMKSPLIEAVGRGDDHPMNIFNNDMGWWEGLPGETTATIQTTSVDPDYLQTIGIELVNGRYFSREIASDSAAFIINEACAEQLGPGDPVGKRFRVYKTDGHVIGVVKNFHHYDFYTPIEPLAFVLGAAGGTNTVFVRHQPGKAKDAVAYLQSTYSKFDPVFPLEFSFFDQDQERFYGREILTGRLSICFTAIIILISLLGLFGLTLFTTERRTKEIGVRKVLGASTLPLVYMLCKDFIKPVLLSLAVGFPLAWYIMDKFLSQYAFHVDFSIWIFVGTAFAVGLLAVITVAYQSTKAALTNPAETLRME